MVTFADGLPFEGSFAIDTVRLANGSPCGACAWVRNRLDRLQVPVHGRLLGLQLLNLAPQRRDLVRRALRRRQGQERQQTDGGQFKQHVL